MTSEIPSGSEKPRGSRRVLVLGATGMLGHKLGFPGVDRWLVSRMMHLGDSFTDMVERHRDMNIEKIAGRVFKEFQLESVWWGVGYVLVGRAPE